MELKRPKKRYESPKRLAIILEEREFDIILSWISYLRSENVKVKKEDLLLQKKILEKTITFGFEMRKEKDMFND